MAKTSAIEKNKRRMRLAKRFRRQAGEAEGRRG